VSDQSDAGWGGCWNHRQLMPGVWRASNLDAVDWGAVVASGVRTVIDLRNDTSGAGPCVRVHVPLEQGLDTDPRFRELMQRTGLASPLYYIPFCTHWRERVEAAVRAIDAAERGVVFHCHAGWDRTGMLAAILLKRAGVGTAEIVADYAISWQNPDPDEHGPARLAKLAEAGTTWKESLEAFLNSDSSTF